MAHSKSLCVVGGGFAGLAAAHFAATRGARVTLYEASNDYGGRARSGLLPSGGPVELGATWFHGTQQHPLYDLAVEHGIIEAQTKPGPATAPNIQAAAQAGAGSEAQWEMKACRPGEAATLTGPELAAVLCAFEQYSLALAEAEQPSAAAGEPGATHSSAAAAEPGSGSSLGCLLRSRFDQLMADPGAMLLAAAAQQQQPTSSNDKERLTRAFVEGWACRERLQRAYDGFASTDSAGLVHAIEYDDLDGPNVPCPGGMQSIAHLLAQQAAAAGAELHTNSPVQRILWARADGRVAVQVLQAEPSSDSCSDSSSVQERVFDAVVFTASLGVLKQAGAQLFEPPLPGSKWRAIQQLEIGQVDKLFIEWPAEQPAAGPAIQAAPAATASGAGNAAPVLSEGGQAVLATPQQDAAAVGPRRPKVQLHDVDAGASVPPGARPYVTYCLLWPSDQQLWTLQWLAQQQQQRSCAEVDPVYCLASTTGAPAHSSPHQQQQQQQLDQLPEWLLGLHSWRYGDGPEWIKPPHSSSGSGGGGGARQQHQPERAAVLWVVGRAARLLGQLTDSQVLQDLEQLLAAFPAIPRPPGASTSRSSGGGGLLAGCRLLRSSWCRNQFFGGSYSYPGPDATPDTADRLAAPLTAADLPAASSGHAAAAAGGGGGGGVGEPVPLVCFAGEATSRRHMGTMHGAFLSGRREAERLLQAWGIASVEERRVAGA